MKSPIKYVFYIIKENRTYDQILGDVPTGNGDSTLCLFGRKVTPNEHALAKQFVLLDNFYVDGEVSADGHNWCDAAYATDFVEKTWPTHYGRRGGNGESSTTINYPGSGYIWDYCKRAGISYRTYGENLYRDKDGNNALKGHICKAYPRFNLRIKDVQRFQIWKHDFDSLLAIHKVPRLNTIQLPSDHTSGQRIGAFTPTASIADNDYAVGKFVEYISHSPIWMQSAIFILEDDAQNGPDHVDAHRSPAFVISPYVKRNFVCHQMYSTSGMVRTIELILGLPPMSQYDAAADPMWQCFMPKPDTSRYVAKEPKVNIYARNKKQNKSAIRSAAFDFSKPDAAPDELLNKIIWKSVKGEDAKMPAPRRSAFLNITDNEENE
jgi:phospholipase C